MYYNIRGMLRGSGFTIGLKRLICAIYKIENNDNDCKFYFTLNNKVYSPIINCFDIMFINNPYFEGVNYIDVFQKSNKPLNSSRGNYPNLNQRLLANRIIKTHFTYNEKFLERLNNEVYNFYKWKNLSNVITIGYRGTDKSTECKVSIYEDFWKCMDKYKKINKFFIMSDEQEFIEKSKKNFDCYCLNIYRSCDKTPIHYDINNVDKKANIEDLGIEMELSSRQDILISGYSNIYDYISFLNPSQNRIII